MVSMFTCQAHDAFIAMRRKRRWSKKALKLSARAELQQRYTLTSEVLGKGNYGRVRLARCNDTEEEVAVKIIPKRMFKSASIPRLRREAAIMRRIRHESIVRLLADFEDDKEIILVLELCQGRELYEELRQHGRFTTRRTRQLLRQLLEAVEYLHSEGVCHRDIKLENVMCSVDMEHVRGLEARDGIKLIDFGLARSILVGDEIDDEDYDSTSASSSPSASASAPAPCSPPSPSCPQAPPSPPDAAAATAAEPPPGSPPPGGHEGLRRMMSKVGSVHYTAPQVLDPTTSYGAKCDVWAVGVIGYILLTGVPPFAGRTAAAVAAAVQSGKGPDFRHRALLDLNARAALAPSPASGGGPGVGGGVVVGRDHDAVDLLRRLLCVEEGGRPTAAEALAHPFFSAAGGDTGGNGGGSGGGGSSSSSGGGSVASAREQEQQQQQEQEEENPEEGQEQTLGRIEGGSESSTRGKSDNDSRPSGKSCSDSGTAATSDSHASAASDNTAFAAAAAATTTTSATARQAPGSAGVRNGEACAAAAALDSSSRRSGSGGGGSSASTGESPAVDGSDGGDSEGWGSEWVVVASPLVQVEEAEMDLQQRAKQQQHHYHQQQQRTREPTDPVPVPVPGLAAVPSPPAPVSASAALLSPVALSPVARPVFLSHELPVPISVVHVNAHASADAEVL